MKHKNTQPLYIFNRENPQNSEPPNGSRRGLDYIALDFTYVCLKKSIRIVQLYFACYKGPFKYHCRGPHCNPVQGQYTARTGFSLCSISTQLEKLFNTGFPGDENRFFPLGNTTHETPGFNYRDGFAVLLNFFEFSWFIHTL